MVVFYLQCYYNIFCYKNQPLFLIFINYFYNFNGLFYPPFLLILYTLTLQKSTLFYKKSKLFFSKICTLYVTSRYASSSSRLLGTFSMSEIEFSAQAHCSILILESTGLSHTVPLSSCMIGSSISQHASYAGD